MKNQIKNQNLQDKVRSVIGEELPSMEAPNFKEVFDKLNKQSPILANEVLMELRKTASEQVASEQTGYVKKETKLRNFLDKAIRTPGREPGDKSANNQKLVGLGVVGILVLLGLLTVFGLIKPSRPDLAAAQQASLPLAATPASGAGAPSTAALPQQPQTGTSQPTQSQAAPPSETVSFGSVTSPNSPPPLPKTSSALPPLPTSRDTKLVVDTGEVIAQLVVDTEATPEPTLNETDGANPTPVSSGLVVDLAQSSSLGQTQPSTSDPTKVISEPQDPPTWTLSEDDNPYGLEPSASVEPSSETSLTPENVPQEVSSPTLLTPATEDSDPVPSEAGPTPAPSTSAQATNAINALLPALSVISARLVTGITAVDMTDTPVVAEALNDYCSLPLSCPPITFYGVARVQSANYVSVTFSHALVDGHLLPFTGRGLDLSSNPLLVGRVVDEAPAVVQDLLRAALGGVSDYVNAASKRSTTVLLNDGSTVTASQLPSLESFIFGSAASIFDTPREATSVLRVIQIDAGQPIKVLSETLGSE
jgi:hypothetical protein